MPINIKVITNIYDLANNSLVVSIRLKIGLALDMLSATIGIGSLYNDILNMTYHLPNVSYWLGVTSMLGLDYIDLINQVPKVKR